MTHSIKDYKFETEAEAVIFANQQREDKCPWDLSIWMMKRSSPELHLKVKQKQNGGKLP